MRRRDRARLKRALAWWGAVAFSAAVWVFLFWGMTVAWTIRH